ncbi:MAG: CehA/McbA family metallohydrolase domain-containing protein, partial [Planctomycetota bacterium]
KTNYHYQRAIEICQGNGVFEAPCPNKELRIKGEDFGSSVQTALAKGHRLGFIGSTDTHITRAGIGPARCVIISEKFTRQGLWDALYNRSCYATTGKHIILFFTVNGQPMGSEVIVNSPETARNIKWRVIGTTSIKRVDLLRNNIVAKSWQEDNTDDMSGSFSISEPVTKTEWWYLRVIQQDTHLAWSSPVWVDLRNVNIPEH